MNKKGYLKLSLALFVVLMIGSLLFAFIPSVSTLPAGIQEFYLPLPADLTQNIFVDIDNDPTVGDEIHYVVGVTASADNTTVYYDHWENGYTTGAAGDVVVNLNKGQSYSFISSNVPSSLLGTDTYYDGRDRIFVSGGQLQLVVSFWPERRGMRFTDAWEVYPVQAWETEYVIPIGEATPNYLGDFEEVWFEVMSESNGNAISITSPTGTPLTSITLDQGDAYSYEVTGLGAIVTSAAPVQVHILTGDPEPGTAWELRGYTAIPRAYWGTTYYAPVPSWSWAADSEYTNLWLYNPNNYMITVNYQDLTGSGSFTIDANQTRSYDSGAGRYVPYNSSVYLDSTDVFWGIGVCGTGSPNYDWGYALIPIEFLGTDNYVSWAPGTGEPTPTSNGSPVYISATSDGTIVDVDYGPNDGIFDATYTLDRLESIEVYDPDNDNTGMHIVSTDPVALAWGESPINAALGTPFLDAGYTCLPLPPEWIVEIALEVDKTADPTEVETGEQTTFTVVISVPSTAGASVTNINFTDTLPPGWEYSTGSTIIDGSPYADPDSIDVLSSGWILTWNGDWTISPGNSLTIDFKAFPTLSADTDNPNRNGATATGTSLGATLTADDDAYVAIIKPVGGEIIPIEKLSIFLSQYWILILLLLLPFSFVLYKKRDMVIRFHLRIIRFCC